MKDNPMTRTLRLIVGVLAAALSPALWAQVPNENLANNIIPARKKDAAMMQQYSWNCRSEIIQDEKVQDIRIDQVTFGPDGKPQHTLLNDNPAGLPRGFFRKRAEEKKRKETEKYIGDLRKLMEQYTLPSAGKIIDF